MVKGWIRCGSGVVKGWIRVERVARVERVEKVVEKWLDKRWKRSG